jgi:hypothetical protein
MSEVVTLELPADLVRRARALAAATNRRFEDVVAEWIGRVVDDPPVESLPDEQILALCDARLPDAEQSELSELLARNKDGELADTDRGRLNQLMAAYRQGLVQKARAVKEAVARRGRTLSGRPSVLQFDHYTRRSPVPESLLIEVQLPGDLARFRLPAGVQTRLTELLDRQDSGQPLSASERDEAEGLVSLAEFLTLLRLRAERAAG